MESPLLDTIEKIRALTAQLPGMPEFYEELTRMMLVHAKKNADYTGKTGDALFNFKWTAGFNRTNLKAAFRHHEGNKIARLIALDDCDEVANNEPVEDTLSDLAVYVVLEIAARRRCGLSFFQPVDLPIAVLWTDGITVTTQGEPNGES